MISVRFVDRYKEREFSQAVGDFVSVAIFGEPGKIADYCAAAIVDDDRLIAAVLFNNWVKENGVIEMHAGAVDKRWITRPVLRDLFAYPFDFLGCQLCVLRVSEHNKVMQRIAKAVGFKEYVIPRLRGRDEAEHIMTLTDDDWRGSRFNKDSA